MSIATEISRLQTAKSDLKTSIENKGVTVPSATTLDGYAALVDQISGGGGSSDPFTVNHTTIRNGQTIINSVPRLQVDSIFSNKPAVLRIEHILSGATSHVYGYVLYSDELNGCIYLSPSTTNINDSNVITVTSSSFKYRSHTYSYNSSTDCYEYTVSGGGSND